MTQKSTLLIFLSPLIFAHTVRSSDYELINLESECPTIMRSIRYATKNNCVQEPVYATADCYLHKDVARALCEVQEELLSKYGLRLMIFDAYQPPSARKALWELLPDKDYINNPDEEDDHARGCAVDVTLLTQDGDPLDMGTDFDCLTIKAKRSCTTLPIDILGQRALLDFVMQRHGFKAPQDECWWHYIYKNSSDCPVLQAEFKDLK